MRTLFVGNFDFEHRLADPTQRQLPRSVERLSREMAFAWLAIADDGDQILTDATVDESFCEQQSRHGLPAITIVAKAEEVKSPVRLCPWGWTGDLRQLAHAHGWASDAPDADAVRMVNSRQFSFDLERTLGLAPEGAVAVRSLEELDDVLSRRPGDDDRWVVKAPFGMSARERMLGRGRQIADSQLSWLRKRLSADGVAFFEPWLDRIAEAGLQFTIPEQGPPVLEGVTPLLTDAQGVYRGSRFDADPPRDAEWMTAVDAGREVAERAQAVGYFGPLGIDACRYRDPGGKFRLRPIQDVNGRYTMGRLSLGFRRLLDPGEVGSWLHVPLKADRREAACARLDDRIDRLAGHARIIRTSPQVIDGAASSHAALVVIAQDVEQLKLAQQALFA